MAIAVILAAALFLLIPEQFRLGLGTYIVYPVVLVSLLVVLVFGDPGRIDRESRPLRAVTGLMVVILTSASAAAAFRLVAGILRHKEFDSPAQLLRVGAIAWITTIIAFALWYWHLDSGGPAARANGSSRTRPAFRFPEQSIPDLVDAGWYPQFVDYLALSFNTATAFSPTDVSPIRHWSKLWLIFESMISLTLLLMVVARAVNVL